MLLHQKPNLRANPKKDRNLELIENENLTGKRRNSHFLQTNPGRSHATYSNKLKFAQNVWRLTVWIGVDPMEELYIIRESFGFGRPNKKTHLMDFPVRIFITTQSLIRMLGTAVDELFVIV
jgi:hypothetical protein